MNLTKTITLPTTWGTYMTSGNSAGLTDYEVAHADLLCQHHGVGYAGTFKPANVTGLSDFVCEKLDGVSPSDQHPMSAGLQPSRLADVQLTRSGRKALRTEVNERQAHLPKLPTGSVVTPTTLATHQWPLAKLTKDQLVGKAIELGVTDFGPYGKNAVPAPTKLPAPTVTPAPAPTVTPTVVTTGRPSKEELDAVVDKQRDDGRWFAVENDFISMTKGFMPDVRGQHYPGWIPADFLYVIDCMNRDEDEDAPPAPKVTPAPAPTVTPAPAPKVKTLPQEVALDKGTRVSAKKAFGLQFKALAEVDVTVFPVGHYTPESHGGRVPTADPDMYLGYEEGKLLADVLRTMDRVNHLPQGRAYLSNLWLHGHKGTGKSALMRQVAAVTGRPIYEISIKPTTTIAELLGDYDTRSVGQGADAPLWIDGLLTKAIKTPNAIIVLDEYSRGTQLGVSLNGPLMNRVLQILETGTNIPFAQGVNILVTDNSDGLHDDSGVYDGDDLDASQLDRFPTMLEVSYLPPAKEVKVLDTLLGGKIPDEIVTKMVDIAGAARASASSSSGDPRFRPSLRGLQSWGHAITEGRDVHRSFTQTMLIGVPAETKEAGTLILLDQMTDTMLADPLNYTGEPSDDTDDAHLGAGDVKDDDDANTDGNDPF